MLKKLRNSTLVLLSLCFIYVTFVIFTEDRFSSISKFKKNIKYAIGGQVATSEDQYWAKEILNGGYLLHFRHAERNKWIDVQMYDVLESNFKNYNFAERHYFSEAVCLNSRGQIQAEAMGDVIDAVGLPVGKVVSSVSCRARQSANLMFDGYESAHSILVHRGPYNENSKVHASDLKSFYLKLLDSPPSEKTNVVVIAHNDVISRRMFSNKFMLWPLSLEEGGFYVISKKDAGLFLEHEFHNFQDFARIFYLRKK